MEITNEEFAEQLDKIFDEMKDLLVLKNKSYGSASFKGDYKFAISGNCHRLSDKINRYINLINSLLENKKIETFDENVKDTLMDILGYATIGLMIYNNKDIKK